MGQFVNKRALMPDYILP